MKSPWFDCKGFKLIAHLKTYSKPKLELQLTTTLFDVCNTQRKSCEKVHARKVRLTTGFAALSHDGIVLPPKV